MTIPGALLAAPSDDGCARLLDEVRQRLSDPGIGEDELWSYIYGVMHAPDWRERFAEELETSAPRFPSPPAAKPSGYSPGPGRN